MIKSPTPENGIGSTMDPVQTLSLISLTMVDSNHKTVIPMMIELGSRVDLVKISITQL